MKVLISLSALFAVLLSAIASGAETLRIVVKETSLREQCRFLAPVRAKLQYSDSVEVIARESDWFRVSIRKVTGCIHKSAVEEKTYAPSGASARYSGASSDEVVLAGKGFNPEVEQSYKRQHRELNFQSVDRIEAYRVSDEALRAFIESGGLKQP